MRRGRKCNSTNRKAIVPCILAGDVQIGKTRWLQALVSDLEARGAVCGGVIAPGVWCEDEAGSFDKLGIDNELMPTHEVVHFARHVRLAPPSRDALCDRLGRPQEHLPHR